MDTDAPAPRAVRVRLPPPRVRSRLPSGRGATEQPNASGDGDAALTPRFWGALVLTGGATGLLGVALMGLLVGVERLAYGPLRPDFQSAVSHASGPHRVVALLVAGLFGGLAWYVLRRFTPGRHADLDDVLWDGGRLSVRRSVGTSVISEIVVGLGASMGREAAPKLLGGVAGSLLGTRFGLSAAQVRLLMACGGGAGLACVYDVPLGGALFTAEVLLGVLSVPTLLPALACSAIATGMAWLTLTNGPTYAGVPAYHVSGQLVVFALVAGPLLGLVAVGFIRLIGLVSHHRARGLPSIPVMVAVFGAVGLLGVAYPQLFGNGRDMAHDVLLGSGAVGTLLVLAALKPLVTAATLGTGASGGLFTPVMSTGAVLGGGLGLLWSLLWHGAPVGAYAMIGMSALIGAAMQAPATGLVLVLELTHSGFGLMVPLILATVLATVVARWLDGYSIYTARLPART